jgi:hypothetical protein
MGEDLNFWAQRLRGLDKEQIVELMNEAGLRGLSGKQLSNYIMDKYQVLLTKDPHKKQIAERLFNKKWNPEPESDLEPPAQPEPAEPEESDEDLDEDDLEDEDLEDLSPEEEAEILEAAESEPPELIQKIEPEPAPAQLEAQGQEKKASTSNGDIQFNNLVLKDLLEVGKPKEPQEEDIPQALKQARERPRPLLRRPITQAEPEEMLSYSMDGTEYERYMKPLKPFYEITRRNPELLIQFAQQFDLNSLPPYFELRKVVINHPIKDQQNSIVVVSSIDPEKPDKVMQKELIVPAAIDMTRILAEQMYYQGAINNYDIIVDKMTKEREQLTSLIYLLEMYCERKERSPFNFNIPKEHLAKVVTDSFKGIETMIRGELLKEILGMKTDLKGEMGDVGQAMEKALTNFDVYFKDALERVLWKVKTDVEATNLEDIRRSLLHIMNKRSLGYMLGAACNGVYNMMLDDLERRAIQENFKLEAITEHRKYRENEIAKRMGYKFISHISAIIKKLARHKLIVLYSDGTFSLSK